MRAKHFRVLTTPESRVKIWIWYQLNSAAKAVAHSYAVVLLLWIHCLLLIPLLLGFYIWPLFGYTNLSALSSFVIILMGKLELGFCFNVV